MNTLDKAMSRSATVISTAHEVALRMKDSGMLQSMITPSMSFGPGSDWTDQTKNREGLSMFRSWVYAAINALAMNAAGQPARVGRIKGKEGEANKRGPSGTKAHVLDGMTSSIHRKAADRELEVLTDHDLLKVMERPNPIQYKFQFVYTIVASLNLTGRAYIVRDETKEGMELYAVPSTWVRPDHRDGPFSKFYVVNPRNPGGEVSVKPLDASQVAMIYLPNPSDPMGAISPASSMGAAIRIDDRIQICQEKFFDNGVFPTMVVTVGKDPHPDVPEGIRPRLTAAQRRQVYGSILNVMGGVRNFGKPAIVDGLIESITRLSATQTEMGWDKSEDKTKARILSAFAVHPFMLGETIGVGGYAQAYNIKEVFCDRVNVFLDLMSIVMTHLVGKSYNKGEKSEEELLVWWEKALPNDPSLDWTNLRFARTNGDITQNEFRAKLGFPPDEDRQEAVIGDSTLSAIAGMLVSVGMGSIRPEQAQAVMKARGLPEDLAGEIAGIGLPEENLQQATDQLGEAIASLRTNPLQLAHEIIEAL